ncbi:hypothetical protein GPECTOR_8g83 [Gonium pectorale]|uniref:Uncharacterized protein n=1 Tax=Gonium pectorale TaxID=33097 RepID=A0A150GTN9_GONPE|nr:hypothetical protein GPECTOR_8g83 [Gonium pectorale]|eukprot:KXZ53092.1 hypothetical protein GPECTOR_8g83 [Gonium pectorale]
MLEALLANVVSAQFKHSGTSRLSLSGTDLVVDISIQDGTLQAGQVIAYQVFPSEAAFQAAIGLPAKCARISPGRLERQSSYSDLSTARIMYDLSALAVPRCTATRLFLTVHLDVVSR